MTRGRVALVVLGCAKNQVEAESMSSRLAQSGWEMTADLPNASVLVVHTCGFLEAARQEALQTVADLRKAAPRAFLVMSGCFAQYLGGKTLPGVDALIGTGEFGRLPDLLSKVRSGKWEVGGEKEGRKTSHLPLATSHSSSPSGYHDASRPRPLRPGQWAAYLRVSEGCNHRCTFCIIPQLRGNLKSRPPEEILLEARNLVDRGVREITIISQDTSDYGRDLSPRVGLTDLLKQFLPWGDLRWLRLLYTYPSEVGDDLIDMLAGEEKLCGYLDMPLQHVSDRILKSMKRDWGQKETLALLDRLRARVPTLTLRTTLIVGYPGETDADFDGMLRVVEQGTFDHLGVFPYSLEQRSPSAALPEAVPADVVRERWDRLLAAQTRVIAAKAKARTGSTLTVLAEAGPDGRMTVRGAHQAPEVDGRVLLARDPDRAGFYEARVTGSKGVDLRAELLEVPGAAPRVRRRRVAA